MKISRAIEMALDDVIASQIALDIEQESTMADWAMMVGSIGRILLDAMPRTVPPGDLTDSEWFYRNTAGVCFSSIRDSLERIGFRRVQPFSRLSVEMARSGLRVADWADLNAAPIAHDAHNVLRNRHTCQFGFPVITDDAIRAVSEVLGTDNAMLEIGSGNGYLACEMQARGFPVVPTDPYCPPSSNYLLGNETYTEVLPLDGNRAMDEFPDRDVLYSWPELADYPAEILRRFTGRHLVYIGEKEGGCTGGDAFHGLLSSERFDLVREVALPQFHGRFDSLHIYRRVE